MPVTLESDGVGRYPQEVEAAVYFCCLEALQNIAKYADASTATIRLGDGSGTLTFEVTDDGRGFDPGSTGYGTGLQGMADRLDALGRLARGAKRAGAGNDRRGSGAAVVGRSELEQVARASTPADARNSAPCCGPRSSTSPAAIRPSGRSRPRITSGVSTIRC